jgi:hypothetical protein
MIVGAGLLHVPLRGRNRDDLAGFFQGGRDAGSARATALGQITGAAATETVARSDLPQDRG